MSAKPLTGRKVFFIIAAAFGVIITVNLLMAALAVGTFPGLETKNSYVASQRFDADRAAQLALGWNVSAEAEDGMLLLSITDAEGQAIEPALLSATLGRATHVGDDQIPEFTFDGAAFVAAADLAPGNWNLRLRAVAANGTEFRQRVVIYVDDSP